MKKLHEDGILMKAPNGHVYANVLTTLRHSRDSDAGEVMERLIAEYEPEPEKGTVNIRRMYESLMKHHASSGQAEKTEHIMEKLYRMFQEGCEDLEPSTSTYNIVLEAWMNSAAPRAAERATAIVQHMHELDGVKFQKVRPNNKSYYLLSLCWQKSRLPTAKNRLDQILKDWEELGL